MKPSRRNILRMEAEAAKRAAGPPVSSKYERKHMTAEQLIAREKALAKSGKGHTIG